MLKSDVDSRSPAAFTIEDMNLEDLEEVIQIEESSQLSRWGHDGYRKELVMGEQTIMLVARPTLTIPHAVRVLGFLCSKVVVDEWHINNIATRAEWRRQGIARQLLIEGANRARELGAATGHLEVRASNWPAQLLYQAFGFFETYRRKGYYSNPTEDAVLMRLLLR